MCGGFVGDILDGVGDLVEGVGDAIGDTVQGIGDVVGDVLSSDLGKVALVGAGLYFGLPALGAGGGAGAAAAGEALAGEALGGEALAALGGEAAASAITPEMLAAANATLDPIAALNASAGWTAADSAYLGSIGLGVDGLAAGGAEEPLSGIDLGGPGGSPATMPEPVTPSGPGYYDETTGEFISDPNGGLQGPIDPEVSGNVDTMKDWTVDPSTGKWSNGATGEVFESTPWDPSAPGVSGKDIMDKAGALPSVPPGLKTIAKLINGVGAGTGAAGAIKKALGGDTGNAASGGSQSPRDTFGQASQSQYVFDAGKPIEIPISTLMSILGPRTGK